MAEHIIDDEGRRYAIVTTIDEEDYYSPFVYDGRRWVGEAKCLIPDNHTLELAYIGIRERVAGRRPRILFFIPWRLWCRLTDQEYRGKGLGTALLRHVIDYARKRHFTRIVGAVVKHQLAERPWLLEGYVKHGFEVIHDGVAESGPVAAWLVLDLEQNAE